MIVINNELELVWISLPGLFFNTLNDTKITRSSLSNILYFLSACTGD